MITVKLRQLEAARAKMASLEKAISAHRNKELGALPAKYGFDNVDDFIQAVRSAGGKRGRGRPAKAAAPAAAAGKKRRRRAVITDATRADVKKMVAAGKTGSEIAKSLKISLPSVQNIKKALGLVKSR